MIYETLYFLACEVNEFLDLKLEPNTDPRLKIGNVSRALDDSLSGTNSLTGKAVLSLVNIEEDRVFKHQENFRKTDSTTIYKSPPLCLNLYLLFAVNKAEYEDALKWLAVIMQFFQYQNVFTATTHPNMNPSIQKLVVDLYSLNFEQVNHLWSTLGGKYLPSAMYKVRQITLDEDFMVGETGLIREIQFKEKMTHPRL